MASDLTKTHKGAVTAGGNSNAGGMNDRVKAHLEEIALRFKHLKFKLDKKGNLIIPLQDMVIANLSVPLKEITDNPELRPYIIIRDTKSVEREKENHRKDHHEDYHEDYPFNAVYFNLREPDDARRLAAQLWRTKQFHEPNDSKRYLDFPHPYILVTPPLQDKSEKNGLFQTSCKPVHFEGQNGAVSAQAHFGSYSEHRNNSLWSASAPKLVGTRGIVLNAPNNSGFEKGGDFTALDFLIRADKSSIIKINPHLLPLTTAERVLESGASRQPQITQDPVRRL